MENTNNYYVYEWFDMDTGEVLYVGKGRNNRWKSKNRNKKFKEYIETHNCDVRKIKENMSEDDAYVLEKQTILKYRNMYSILCNIDDGGRDLPVLKGEKNPMYHISPKERMDEETYEKWRKNRKPMGGENNPNYGKHTLKGRKQSPEHILHKSGARNGKARPIEVYDLKGEIVGNFGCKKDFVLYLIKNGIEQDGDIDNIRHKINWNLNKRGYYKNFIIKEIKK